MKITKKLVISTEIYSALCDYQVKVDRYTSLTEDDYSTDFSFAFDEVEDSKKRLDRLISKAEKVA